MHDSDAILARAPGLTAAQLLAALARCGSTDALLQASRDELAACGIAAPAIDWLRRPDPALVASDLAWRQRLGLGVLLAGPPDYPPLLAATAGAPAALYLRGEVAALSQAQLAMVGSRNPTASGRETAWQFARHFADTGLAITSGLALGIDAACHEGCLAANGVTIAVCGTGLDAIYPAAHKDLAARILATGGALVSEFPPGTAPRRHHFPQRNRIIAGLALGCLVIEAARDSGSLITARQAGEYGREVFAVPGSIHNPLAHGCHQLIRDGAKLVETARHVLEELRLCNINQVVTSTPTRGRTATGAAPQLDKDYEILLDALGFEPTSVDQLVARTGIAGDSIASMLLILELKDLIEPCPGGRYSRIPDNRL
ncbi:MAG: DNA-processing protein DprA [Steroidobacteraceae bacterium]